MKAKLLIIGGLPNEKYNCQYGGATVLMKNLLSYLTEKGVCYRFVQTNKYVDKKTLEYKKRKNQISFIFNFLFNIFWCDVVVFNFSDHATINMFPCLERIAKRLKKKVVLRKFGGSIEVYLRKVTEAKRQRALGALKQADAILFETQAGINYLKEVLGNDIRIHWYPNVRTATSIRKDANSYSHKLVFMSHISDEKGVSDLLIAFARLSGDYSLDLYGAIKENKYLNYDWSIHGVSYKGQIDSNEVLSTLCNYSLLILPSSYREGYPGIIIEAMSVGMPVIATNVGGIPEIVTDGINGRLVTPGDISGLVSAIDSINKDNYPQYCSNAYKSFLDSFNAEVVNNRIMKVIQGTIEK